VASPRAYREKKEEMNINGAINGSNKSTLAMGQGQVKKWV
jgi:hypothetical protein